MSDARFFNVHLDKAEGQPIGGHVKINVGGSVFEASISTLTRFDDSMFCALVAGRWQRQDELFIDRNPTHFGKVLDYLRDGKYVVLPKDDYSLECLQREAEFYNLPGLVEICSSKRHTEGLDNSSCVKINVGGTVFETSLSTLTKKKDSVFSAMLVKCGQGRKELFFDRNPELFPMVMDYLRDGMISKVLMDTGAQIKLQREAEFYNLPDLSMCVYKSGDKVQFARGAIEGYCLLDVRKSCNGRVVNQCKICGVTISPRSVANGASNRQVPTYIGAEKDGASVTYGVSLEETIPMSDLKHKGGTVTWIDSTCCTVAFIPCHATAYHVTHLPKTAVRLSEIRIQRRESQ